LNLQIEYGIPNLQVYVMPRVGAEDKSLCEVAHLAWLGLKVRETASWEFMQRINAATDEQSVAVCILWRQV
jgi:hypothetical protein